MPRYFFELAYMGTRYSGFQIQENAVTVQAMFEKALACVLRVPIHCTGSSRTDAGVHALQNYFHADVAAEMPKGLVYQVNAILPPDIALRSVRPVHERAHCRFDALSRAYRYVLYTRKDPFLNDRGWFYPYPLDGDLLAAAASAVGGMEDFTAFARKRGQTKTMYCKIERSEWLRTVDGWEYHVRANRFLRGMVRGLVGTMLQVGRGRLSLEELRRMGVEDVPRRADFTTPARGLTLEEVRYPDGYFEQA